MVVQLELSWKCFYISFRVYYRIHVSIVHSKGHSKCITHGINDAYAHIKINIIKAISFSSDNNINNKFLWSSWKM